MTVCARQPAPPITAVFPTRRREQATSAKSVRGRAERSARAEFAPLSTASSGTPIPGCTSLGGPEPGRRTANANSLQQHGVIHQRRQDPNLPAAFQLAPVAGNLIDPVASKMMTYYPMPNPAWNAQPLQQLVGFRRQHRRQQPMGPPHRPSLQRKETFNARYSMSSGPYHELELLRERARSLHARAGRGRVATGGFEPEPHL